MKAFDIPLSISNGTLTMTDNYDRIVRNQVIDALTTNQGERVMHPDWGCDIQSVLFDPSDMLERQDTAAYVRDRLVQFVPRSFIKSVKVDVPDSEPNVVFIDVHYKSSSYMPESSVTVGLDMSADSTGSSQ
jgi:phage baseplate assembly protein W